MSDSDTQDPFSASVRADSLRRDAIADLRQKAAGAYESAGLPTRRVERWKFTDLKGLRKLGFAQAAPVDVAATPESATPESATPESAAAVDGVRLTLVNGRVVPALSDLDNLPKGVRVRTIADALAEGDADLTARLSVDAGFTDAPMAALNTAALEDGLLIDIADGAIVDDLLHLVFINVNQGTEAATASFPRLALNVGAAAQATIVESHVGAGTGPTLSNGVSEIALGPKASLAHSVLQNEALQSYHLGSTSLSVDEGASYNGFVLQLGAALARREVRAILKGAKAEAHINGAYLGDGDRVVDNTLFVDHAAPETVSRETFKGVLDNRSRGVFQAKTLVRQVAQKTDGQQLHKALLLADGAEVDAKPELEIYADDVACAHGATVGDLNKDQLFYLRARGIPEHQARAMLIEAFMIDSLNVIERAQVREAFQAALAARLNQIEGIGG